MLTCATLSGLSRSPTAKISDHNAGGVSLLLCRDTIMSQNVPGNDGGPSPALQKSRPGQKSTLVTLVLESK